MEKYMTYKETTDFLFSQLPMYQRIGKAAYKANLDNTIQIDQYLGHPHKNYKTIHIAGTNGKGSVSHMLASVLMESGLKTGLYTSPHLKDFRERIRINKEMISEEEVIGFVANHKSMIESIQPSFFELTVAMAFDHFSKHNVDVAVVEVGLGGRLDSTNIINPVLSVITNIDLDHTQFLGTTLPEIAREKGGIIKPEVPVVIGEMNDETRPVFHSIAKERHCRLIEAEKKYQSPYSTLSTNSEQIFQVYSDDKLTYKNLASDLLGTYQRKNICTVLTAIDQLCIKGFHISEENIYTGIAKTKLNTSLMGRWQIIGNNPLVVCDIAHNTNGLAEIVKQINNTPWQHLHMVIGMVQDKNIESVLNILPKEATYYFTKADIPRSLNENDLLLMGQKAGLKGHSYPNVETAILEAKKKSNSNDLIFIGGSTFIVAEAI